MQNSKNPRTDALELSLTTWTIDDLNKSMSHARELERELTQARVFLEVSTKNTEAAQNSFHAEMKQRGSAEAERDTLRKELAESQSWVRASMESTAIAASTIAQLTRQRDEARLLINEDTRSVIVENDWLRKMVDAFAENGDCGDEWLMADYRELPHVRARKTK